MGINKRKLGPKPKQESLEAKEREQDTIREINKVLDHKEVRLTPQAAPFREVQHKDRCRRAGRFGSTA